MLMAKKGVLLDDSCESKQFNHTLSYSDQMNECLKYVIYRVKKWLDIYQRPFSENPLLSIYVNKIYFTAMWNAQ